MFQKEVADRIVAKLAHPKIKNKPNFRLYTNPKLVLNISSGSFIPKPKVDSALIYFEILKKPRFKINQKDLRLLLILLLIKKKDD